MHIRFATPKSLVEQAPQFRTFGIIHVSQRPSHRRARQPGVRCAVPVDVAREIGHEPERLLRERLDLGRRFDHSGHPIGPRRAVHSPSSADRVPPQPPAPLRLHRPWRPCATAHRATIRVGAAQSTRLRGRAPRSDPRTAATARAPRATPQRARCRFGQLLPARVAAHGTDASVRVPSSRSTLTSGDRCDITTSRAASLDSAARGTRSLAAPTEVPALRHLLVKFLAVRRISAARCFFGRRPRRTSPRARRAAADRTPIPCACRRAARRRSFGPRRLQRRHPVQARVYGDAVKPGPASSRP